MKSALNIKALTKLTYKKMILHKITITECTSKDNINMRFSGPSSRRRASALNVSPYLNQGKNIKSHTQS